MSTTGQPRIARIRIKLCRCFDDSAFSTFCLDYFPAVYDRLTQAMRLDDKISCLLDHCRRQPTGFERLLEHLCDAYKLSNFQREELKPLIDELSTSIGSLPPDAETTKDAAYEQEYRDYLIGELKDHTIRGFAPQVAGRVIGLPLAKIFLPLQAVEGRPALAEYAEEDLWRQASQQVGAEMDWQRRREEMEKRYTQLSARQAAQRPLKLAQLLKNRRAVLLGDPGSGKTTITRYVTYALAAGDATHVGKRVHHLIPVLVRIANYANAYEGTPLHLTEYIEKELTPRAEFGHYLRDAIERGACLIILDGLDEVSNTALRIEVTNRIQQMVASFSQNHFLVTSRIIGYEQSPLTREFKHATLKELTKEDQERFVRLWYDAIYSEIPSSHAMGADELIKALRNKPQIARMAASPLLLTIMVLMHWRGTKLPSRRVQVYQNATDTLIEYWTALRDVELDAEEIKAILAPIAHHILSSNVGGVIAHHDLRPRFYQGIFEERGCDQREAKRIGRQLLKELGEQSGIFLERGRDANHHPVYGFLHQTFGEYLAALHMAQEMFNGTFELQTYIHRSIWHEPLLLMAAHLSIVSRGHTRTLIRDILAFPALYEDTLQRNLLLAADCLADDIHVAPGQRDEVLQKLAQLLAHPAPQVQDAAVERYERLAITRHRQAALTALQRLYPLDDLAALNQQSAKIRLNLATALIHLGELDAAQPILWPLDDKKYTTKPRGSWADKKQGTINRTKVQHLRFKGWPVQASDYWLQLQAEKDLHFSITIGTDLGRSTIGPIDAEQARRVLSEQGLLTLLEALRSRMKSKEDQAKLDWLAALAPQTPSPSAFLSLLTPETPPQIRSLAARQLLDGEHRTAAISVLQELTRNEPQQAPAAARALLEAEEETDLEWHLLRDTALMANDRDAPEAITTLLQAEDHEIALPAALHLLATCQLERGNRDSQLRRVVKSLLEHDQREVGLAAARWLALRPGYKYRFEMCEMLRKAGRVEASIFLLQCLAYECHDKNALQACERLLMLREAEPVVPLLAQNRQASDPDLAYQASLALALAGILPTDSVTQPRHVLKLGILNQHQQAYETAQAEFCQTGLQALKALKATDEQARSVQALAQFSLNWLASPFDSPQPSNLLAESVLPAVSLNLALFDLRAGRIEQAHQRLVRLLTEVDHPLSLPVRLQVLETVELIVAPETTRLLIQSLTHKNSHVRSSAAKGLAKQGDSTALVPLIAALNDEDSQVRSSAVRALGKQGDSTALEPLIAALSDKDDQVRFLAATALGKLGDSKALKPLIAALNDEEGSVRNNTAHSLGDLGDSIALQPLITALSDEEWMVRSAAARALSRLGNGLALHPLMAALNDDESDVRNRAAYAIRELGNLSTLQPQLTAFGKQNSSLRHLATCVLGQLGDSTVLQPLIAALDNEDKRVRALAADALGKLGDATALQPLIAALSDGENDVRSSAARALAELGDTTALQPLIAALSDGESDVRSSAADALGQLHDSMALQPLIAALSDEESRVRSSAADALGELGDCTALLPLITALSDEESEVRCSAADALGQLGDCTALPSLIIALNDQKNRVRHFAARALGELGDRSAIQPLITALIGNQSSACEALGRIEATEAIPLLVATSGAADSYDADRYATALIHLDAASAQPVLERYARQFHREGSIERLRGQMLWELGEMEAALASLRKATEKEHDSEELLALAHFYLEQTDFEKAQVYVKQARAKVRWAPDDAVCQLSQAVVLWLMGKQAEGLKALQEARRRNRHVTKAKDLQYDHFWRRRALTALEEMLEETGMKLIS